MQRYFEQHFPHVHFFRDIVPQIKVLHVWLLETNNGQFQSSVAEDRPESKA